MPDWYQDRQARPSRIRTPRNKMARLLTPKPGTYMIDPETGKPLVANSDVRDADDPLVKSNPGKWRTPAPGSPAAGAEAPVADESDEAPDGFEPVTTFQDEDDDVD